MCKPGSACCGCGVASSGIGMAVVVVGATTVVSLAAALINDILTAILITVFTLAAAAGVLLAVILRRTRGVIARPGRPPRSRGATPQALPAGRVRLAGPARRALPAARPLAIEAPAPASQHAISLDAYLPPAAGTGQASEPGGESTDRDPAAAPALVQVR